MLKKKRSWLVAGIIILILIALYFVTRLPNITKLPIFTDEAIYIRWSQIGAQDASWRFISLTDGKQPMFTWIMMALLRGIHADPLFVGRLTSVLAGCFSLIGIGLLAYVMFGSIPIMIITALLYIIYPFSLWYDRLALYDSLVATFSIWSLALAIILAKKPRLDFALIFGMVLGLGMLNKTSGFINLYLLPFTLLVFDWGKKDRPKRLLTWMGLILVSVVLSQVIYSILRLSPYFYIINQKNAIFVYPIREWLSHPFRFLIGNLRGLFDWVISYLSWPLFLAVFLPFFALGSRLKEKIILIIWWIVPLVGLALFGRILYPRFILFMTMPLLLMASLTIYFIFRTIKQSWLKYLIVLCILLPSLYTDMYVIGNPIFAPITGSDRGQLIDDWPAGGGIREAVAILAKEAASQKVEVFTDGTFGLLPYALEIYLVDNPNIKIHGIWPLPTVMPDEILEKAVKSETFVILNQHETPATGWPMILIGEYKKGTSNTKSLRLYRVVAPLGLNITSS
jgi:4-amino-4-deoxy-L-arabinose transferase-like glycosyltransferase